MILSHTYSVEANLSVCLCCVLSFNHVFSTAMNIFPYAQAEREREMCLCAMQYERRVFSQRDCVGSYTYTTHYSIDSNAGLRRFPQLYSLHIIFNYRQLRGKLPRQRTRTRIYIHTHTQTHVDTYC